MTKELMPVDPTEVPELKKESSDLQEGAAQTSQFQGRGAFIVETTASGVAVAATIITEDGRALAMPAIFPNISYAMSQIDELRAAVIRHFDQAAQVGAQLIAEQGTMKNRPNTTHSPHPEDEDRVH